MDIIESNKLIALFMGAKEIATEEFDFRGIQPDNQFLQYWHVTKLKYNTSWNWLIPVVEKIKNDKSTHLLLPAGGIAESIAPYINATRPINNALLKLDIKTLYISVVEFIKWYNFAVSNSLPAEFLKQ